MFYLISLVFVVMMVMVVIMMMVIIKMKTMIIMALMMAKTTMMLSVLSKMKTNLVSCIRVVTSFSKPVFGKHYRDIFCFAIYRYTLFLSYENVFVKTAKRDRAST